MKYNFRLGGLFLAALLAACTQELRAPPQAPSAASHPADLKGATLYRISGADSSLHVLVYRGGTLASLGHNHVVSSHDVSGYVWRHTDSARTGFEIAVPVAGLIVDDDEARRAEGADFPVNVSDEAKLATRRNLLSAALLDVEHFPRVFIRSLDVSGAPDAPQVAAALTIKDATRHIVLPVLLQAGGDSLRIRGEFSIAQSDFGIKPYSVALGALQVRDELRIKFELVARRDG